MRLLPASILICALFVTFASSPANADDDSDRGAVPPSAPRPQADAAAAAAGDVLVHAKAELAGYLDTDAVSVLTPGISANIEDPLEGWSLGGSYLVDIVSAASVDIVSSASPHWVEIRHAGTVSGKFKTSGVDFGLSGAVSSEPDYLSLSGGGNVSFDLDEKNIVPLIGYSFNHDTAGRSGTPFTEYSLVLNRHTINGAVEFDLNPSTMLTLIGDAIIESGNQEKPYRFVPLFDSLTAANVSPGETGDTVNRVRLPTRVAEALPTSRHRFALSGRFATRADASTFVATERVYTDDWGVKASTSDLRYVFDVGKRWYVWPHVRFHVQTGATFWKLAYVGALGPGGEINVPAIRTGDRELSPLTVSTLGAGVRFNIGPSTRPESWSLVFEAEGANTHYSQALFITNRYSALGSLQLESTF